ncbi:hypothetical protein LCGC14_1041260 [marine sediment metagenome]|uniref:DNA recombination-mediator protein A n=1 Tax=marine sediment metagenome TaxID=412755 RepID=A0A0F9QXV9_9ZZZZ
MLYAGMLYAGIGSRDLTPAQINTCEKLGAWFAQQGHILCTGNAKGADQAFARGVNSVDPTRVRLFLPWSSYERQAIVPGNKVISLDDYPAAAIARLEVDAAKHHGAWHRLKQGGRKLMVRNGLIIEGPAGPVGIVLAFPSNKVGGGGTGQGIRLAESKGIEVIDLNAADKSFLHALCERVR